MWRSHGADIYLHPLSFYNTKNLHWNYRSAPWSFIISDVIAPKYQWNLKGSNSLFPLQESAGHCNLTLYELCPLTFNTTVYQMKVNEVYLRLSTLLKLLNCITEQWIMEDMWWNYKISQRKPAPPQMFMSTLDFLIYSFHPAWFLPISAILLHIHYFLITLRPWWPMRLRGSASIQTCLVMRAVTSTYVKPISFSSGVELFWVNSPPFFPVRVHPRVTQSIHGRSANMLRSALLKASIGFFLWNVPSDCNRSDVTSLLQSLTFDFRMDQKHNESFHALLVLLCYVVCGDQTSKVSGLLRT